MGKCEVIEGKKTNWLGLWYHKEYLGFSSQAINLATLKKFKGVVRILVKKNRFYNNGENGRPNYVFSIVDSNSPTFKDIEVMDDECANEEETYMLTESMVQSIVDDAISCVREYDDGGGYSVGEYEILRAGGKKL